MTYETIDGGAVPIKAWTKGVPVEDSAREQLVQVARLPFVGPHVAVMPDVHWGIGATVGSVIPTRGALVPAACGVDIGCGMCAVRTPLTSQDLGDNAQDIFDMLSSEIPHGRTKDGGEGDRGAWDDPPLDVMSRNAAKKQITLEQHVLDTAGVTCRKDAEVLDESPRAYKNVEDVMRAQSGLVEIVHELRGVVCVKG